MLTGIKELLKYINYNEYYPVVARYKFIYYNKKTWTTFRLDRPLYLFQLGRGFFFSSGLN